MSTITFDTLKYVNRLEQAGATRELASALAEAQKEVFSEVLETTLATKADIVTLDNRMSAFDAKLDAMELRITIKLGTFLAVAVGVLIAVLKTH